MLGKWPSPAKLPETRALKVSALDQETPASARCERLKRPDVQILRGRLVVRAYRLVGTLHRTARLLRLSVGRLGKPDPHRPQRLLAADRQVGDEVELLPALLHVGFQLVMRAPGLLLDDHGDWRVGLSVRAAASHLRQPPRSEERRVGKECRSRW